MTSCGARKSHAFVTLANESALPAVMSAILVALYRQRQGQHEVSGNAGMATERRYLRLSSPGALSYAPGGRILEQTRDGPSGKPAPPRMEGEGKR